MIIYYFVFFVNVFLIYLPFVDKEKRVVMFQIPAATTAIPTVWNDHYYVRS